MAPEIKVATTEKEFARQEAGFQKQFGNIAEKFGQQMEAGVHTLDMASKGLLQQQNGLSI